MIGAEEVHSLDGGHAEDVLELDLSPADLEAGEAAHESAEAGAEPVEDMAGLDSLEGDPDGADLESLSGLDSLDGGEQDGAIVSEEELDTLITPVAARQRDRAGGTLLAYSALGAGFAVAGRALSLRLEEGGTLDMLGPLLFAAVIGAFTALGIGVADQADVRIGWRRMFYTTLSGAVVGTLGSFCLVAPMFQARSTFLRLAAFSAAIALVDRLSRRGSAGVMLGALAGFSAGWLTSVAPWIDPYSPAPLAMAATFGLMGISVGMARRIHSPAA